MLFAELSDAAVATIAGALVTVVSLFIKEWFFDRARGKVIIKKVDDNTEVTNAVLPAVKDKVESATKEVKQQAQDVATISTRAAKVATQTAEAVHGDLTEIKEKINGTIAEKLETARRTGHAEGHAVGLLEGAQLLSRIDDHDKRIGGIEGRLEHVEKGVDKILEKVTTNGSSPPPDKIQERQ